MSLLDDVRFGLRALAKNPGFTAVAVTALGIGANATVFSLVNGLLYKNLPFDHSERVLYITRVSEKRTESSQKLSYPDFRDLKTQSKSFAGMAASKFKDISLSDGASTPERYKGAEMTSQAFSVIGQKPVAGRDFTAADEQPGAAPVVILGYRIWQDRYAKDPSVIGRTVRVNEVPTTIIGVMPPRLQFPFEAEIWMPLVPESNLEKRQNRWFTVFTHLSENATLSSANAEMDLIMKRLEKEYPITNKDVRAHVVEYSYVDLTGNDDLKVMFLAMLGAVGFVLLIACANVANLLLARAVGRAREISIRAALGAGRWRVIRQLLVESVLLSIAGGLLGWLLAIWGIRAFDAAVVPTGKPQFIDFSMDYRALAYLAAITIGTGLLFGLVPALRLSKLDVNTALKDGGRGASGGGRGKYLSGLLVVTEMALAVVLLAGAGLMIRSFLNANRANMGFNPANVLTMRVSLPEKKYAAKEQRISFFDRLKTRLASTPGVQTVAITSDMPLNGAGRFDYELEGAPIIDARQRPSVNAILVSPDFFRAMGDRMLAGREFADSDSAAAPPVAIVNESFAKNMWHGENPVGKRLRVFEKDAAQPWLSVVGVSPDIVTDSDSTALSPILYLPFDQQTTSGMYVIARTEVPPSTLGQVFRHQVQAIDEDLPVTYMMTLEDYLALKHWPTRIFGSLFAIFAATALLLASVGLYAVIAHSVSQRTQEIGVRMALGASSASVLRLIFGQGMRQTLIGLIVGLAAAFGLTRVLASTRALIDVSPSDPLTFALVTLVLGLAAALGCLIPARRAMRVDPIEALRHE